MDENDRIAGLQRRFEALFMARPPPAGNGQAQSPSQTSPELFAPYNPADQEAADGLAMLCEKIADRLGGLDGLLAAVSTLEEFSQTSPVGMVPAAARIFLLRCPQARRILSLPSLEIRQAGRKAPSP